MKPLSLVFCTTRKRKATHFFDWLLYHRLVVVFCAIKKRKLLLEVTIISKLSLSRYMDLTEEAKEKALQEVLRLHFLKVMSCLKGETKKDPLLETGMQI